MPGLGIRKSGNDFDSKIEQLNQKIARILGKKSHGHFPKKTSNIKFMVVVVVLVLALWGATGFYYLDDNQSGVIFIDGRVATVANGMKVGMTLPYPFADVELVDTGSSPVLELGVTDSDEFLTSDLKELFVSAKFSYKVIDPQVVYLNFIQRNQDVSEIVRYYAKQAVHDYAINHSQDDVLKANLTIVANELKNTINKNLAPLGIQLLKFEISSITDTKNSKEEPGELVNLNSPQIPPQILQPQIVQELLQEANNYHNNVIAATKVDIDRFKQLLPQYLADHKRIAEQMYFDMLEDVPANNNYPLLNSSLTELWANGVSAKPVSGKDDNFGERDFSRQVDRMRKIDGR